jgi:YD repeat-containing protein
LSQVTQTNYDPNSGNLLSVTDPNGIATSWQYDPFQRKSQENRPDGTYTTWGYNNCATAGCVNSNNRMTVVKTNFTSNGQTYNIANTYLDQFSRTLVTSAQMVSKPSGKHVMAVEVQRT